MSRDKNNTGMSYGKAKDREVGFRARHDESVSFWLNLNANFQNELTFLLAEIKESKLEEQDKQRFITAYEKRLRWYKDNPSYYSKIDNKKIINLRSLLGSYNAGKRKGPLEFDTEERNKKFQLKMVRVQEMVNAKKETLKLAGLGVLPPKPKMKSE